jgi:tetratricopeptide (TPR) repeat protein
MLQEDYLIRMIRLAVAALQAIFGLKRSGNYQQAKDLIAVTLAQLTGMDDRLINTLDDASLLIVLSNRQGPDYDRMLIVADLLKESGDVYAALGQSADSKARYLRALMIYLEVGLDPVEYSPEELGARIDGVLVGLANQPLPPESLYRLWYYFEKNKQFGRAIQALDELFRQAGRDSELKDQGLAFFQRLVRLEDTELEAGGVQHITLMEKALQLKATGKTI